MNVLEKIAESVQKRLNERKEEISEAKLRARMEQIPLPRSFAEAFSRGEMSIIAEVKFSSPLGGPLSGSLTRERSPVDIARQYLDEGACAISVLTEQDFFKGRPDDLTQIRGAFPDARILMKDFVLEEYQLLEARALGADAVLLIVALLGIKKTAQLLNFARLLGLSAIVEVHDRSELEIASRIGAELIGINNRNLKTLEVSIETSLDLAPLAPQDAILISESGIKTAAELIQLKNFGFSGALVGTSLMKSPMPGKALSQLLKVRELTE